MKVVVRTLARVEMPYSITHVPAFAIGGMPCIAVGSESDGPLVLMRPPEYHPEELAAAPGGFISLCFLRWAGRPFLLASTDFKPVFKAANCVLKAYPLDAGLHPVAEEIGPLPYTHRLGLADAGGKICVLASTLCGGKDSQDDWSKAGGVHASVLPPAPGLGVGAWKFRMIRDGLTKNHGMDAATLHGGTRGFLLSAHEGLFFLRTPNEPSATWESETLAPGEYSDAVAGQWAAQDPEVFTVSPFHGNIVSRHRKMNGTWVRETVDDSIAFGHVVWAGTFLGRPGVLVGARAGLKELALYRPSPAGLLSKEVIDEGAGPSQIVVVDGGRSEMTIFACAHARGEVVRYTVSE